VLEAMTAENIGVGVHYQAVNWHEAHADLPTPAGVANATSIGASTISLPISGGLSDQDVDDVCVAVERVIRYVSK
jgi:dTDP-4-amino-4,6-dideoxygalactose transaminase